MNLKQKLQQRADHYERHAKWERSRAEMATDGSSIQIECIMAAKFNEGRASAMKEAIEIAENITGQKEEDA